MTRSLTRLVTASVVVVALPSAAPCGVKTEEKTQVQFGGLLGGIMNKFGGKAAKEGLVSTVAVAGDRKLTVNEMTGQIIDLTEEKIYDLDMKKKTYQVTTFAELQKKMEEQRAEAEKRAREAQKEQKAAPAQGPQKEYEVDYDLKETGQKRTINGFDSRQVVMTITVREKGRTLAQAGGVILTSDMWLGPKVAALKEIQDFDVRHAKKMAALMAGAGQMSMEQMATLFAMYPGVQKAMTKMQAERVNMEGTPVLTVLTVTGVRNAAQMAEAQKQQEEAGGGLGGLLARKMMKKGGSDPDDPRSTLMTTTNELIAVTPGATAADVALPAGFKQK